VGKLSSFKLQVKKRIMAIVIGELNVTLKRQRKQFSLIDVPKFDNISKISRILLPLTTYKQQAAAFTEQKEIICLHETLLDHALLESHTNQVHCTKHISSVHACKHKLRRLLSNTSYTMKCQTILIQKGPNTDQSF
jgi:hypothetical protein